jgi:integrase
VLFGPTTLRRRARKAWKDAKLEPLTPHDGRHVAASFLLAAGVSLFEVSRYVGHTDVRTTANVYGHLVAGQDTRPPGASTSCSSAPLRDS